MDVMPTLIEAASAGYPATFRGHAIQPQEGTSLLPAMRGDTLPQRGSASNTKEPAPIARATGNSSGPNACRTKFEWELYNLAEDRCETNDLADKPS